MIKSVGDFLKIVNELYPENGEAFFRGQPSSEFDVSSALCRFISECNLKNNGTFIPKFSGRLFDKFEEKFPAYPESAFLENYSVNKIDVLMSAQHYGVPTRLIDWTRNPLVALYFATENVSSSDEYISVFILKETNENKLKISNGKAVIDSMLHDKKIISDIYSCVTYNNQMFMEHLEHNEYLDFAQCKKIINRLHKDLARIRLNCVYGINSENILDMHNGESSNFYRLADEIIGNIVSLKLRFIEEPTVKPYYETISRIEMRLRNGLANHAISPVVSELYGNNHLIIEPLPINNRIKNQQGVFLFSKKNGRPEFKKEEFEVGENVIREKSNMNDDLKRKGVVRIDVGSSFLESIRKELSRYGVSKSFIYPELSSYAEELKNSFLSMYKKN